MNEKISEQIEATRDLLVRANHSKVSQEQIGALIIAIQTLADAVENLNDQQRLIEYRGQ